MNWIARQCFWTRHLGLVLVVAEGEVGEWGWEVSGRIGTLEISLRGKRPCPSLALAKNAAVAAAARMSRIAA